jgi:hypothetical protein
VSATAVSATAVEAPATATMEAAATATMEAAATATVEAAMWGAVKSTASAATKAADWTAGKAASADKATSVTPAATSVTPAAASIAPTGAPAAASPVSVIPRAGADKQSACEPARPVVAIRRTRVRSVSVVPVLAYRCRTNIARPKTHANPDLRL